MKAKAKPRLLDLINQDLDAPRRSRARWLDGLPDDIRPQVEEAKQQWQSGTYKIPASRMAKRIIDGMSALGVESLPGKSTVYDWLTNS